MNTKFRPGLARAMAVEAMLRRKSRLTREMADGLAGLADHIPLEEIERPERLDVLVEFRLAVEDMEEALIVLEAMGYTLHRETG